MEENSQKTLRFNALLSEEMGARFALQPCEVDPDFALKYSGKKDEGVYIKSRSLACIKTAGIRMGEMHFADSMVVHFGSVPPGFEYDFPILGFTFVLTDRFLICVLDLHPLSLSSDYQTKYLTSLGPVAERYAWIPKTAGGRSEVHDWAKKYDSGSSLYRWCDGQYLPDVEQAFKEYVGVFCDCIDAAEPVRDAAKMAAKEDYMKNYRYDYTYKDPGANPLKHHFGEEWGERFMRNFLFAPHMKSGGDDAGA